jgi:TRAP-type C4-dicarboxylate transport system permease small subunit
MIKHIRNTVEKGNLILGYVSGLGILLMGLILFYEVVMRYFFRSPTIWAQETAVYIFMWTMLAGGAYTLQKGKHVRIDLLIEHLSPRTQKMLEMITSTAGMFFCGIVTWQAYEMIASSIGYDKVSATPLRVPMWIPQMALLLGFALLTFQFALIIADRYAELFGKSGKERGEETC